MEKNGQIAERDGREGNDGCQQKPGQSRKTGVWTLRTVSPAAEGPPDQGCQRQSQRGTGQVDEHIPHLTAAAGHHGLVVFVQCRQDGTERGGQRRLPLQTVDQRSQSQPQQQDQDEI